MRALVISPVFPPEPIVSAQTTAHIAEELAIRGHDVTVVTAFPNRPVGKLYPGYRRALYQTERSKDGYNVLRCFSTLSGKSQMLSRFRENVSFGLTSGLAVLAAPRADVIYANSWPIFATGILVLVALLRRIPLIISVQDIYPDSLISQGRLRASGSLARLLTAVDGWIARRCQAVIVISERFAEIYEKRRHVRPDRLHVVLNWIDQRTVSLDGGGAAVRREMGVPEDAFLLVYGGNVGMAAGLEGIIQAFDRWPVDTAPPHLLVAGSGANLEACRALAARVARDKVHFYTPWPSVMTGPVFNAADVLVLPTHRQQSLVSVPSKLISYMLSGRPVIAQAIAGSDLAQIIEEANCGWVVEPEAPGVFAATLRKIIALPLQERTLRGQSGREYALRFMTRETCLPKVIDLLEHVARTRN